MYWSWSQYQHYGHVGQRFLGATLFWSRSCYQSVVTLDNDRGPMPIHKENVTTCKALIRGPTLNILLLKKRPAGLNLKVEFEGEIWSMDDYRFLQLFRYLFVCFNICFVMIFDFDVCFVLISDLF
jgi:hypothetical protein